MMKGNEVIAMYQSFKEKKLIKISDEIYFYRGAKIQKPSEKEYVNLMLQCLKERSEYVDEHLPKEVSEMTAADIDYTVNSMLSCNALSKEDADISYRISKSINIYYTFYNDKPFYTDLIDTIEQAQKMIDKFFDNEEYGAIHTQHLEEDLEVVDKIQSIKELAEKTGRSKTTIYRLADKLGRLPTVEEVLNRPNGRPRKNW